SEAWCRRGFDIFGATRGTWHWENQLPADVTNEPLSRHARPRATCRWKIGAEAAQPCYHFVTFALRVPKEHYSLKISIACIYALRCMITLDRQTRVRGGAAGTDGRLRGDESSGHGIAATVTSSPATGGRARMLTSFADAGELGGCDVCVVGAGPV
ncbi:hypothetical protein K7459_29715, partial [Pseudomonas fluorescens]|nr:hypothetical protein [Pseudomonas fluorescens]